ncbi:MAG: ABC transporter permease [Gammaproteobacteria bacterium]|nr:ABC transporter permease [Gammaproteobacteria bacterium]
MSQLAQNLAVQLPKGRSLWRDAYLRFRANRAATFSIFMLMTVIAVVLIGPSFQQYSHEDVDWTALADVLNNGAPSFETGHYFGTDELGRDLYARVLQGSAISLWIGLVGALISAMIGICVGMFAAFSRGWVDMMLMRFVDILISLPTVFLYILIFIVFGRSITMMFVGLAAFSWMTMAIIVRGQTLAVLQMEYVEAARAMGQSSVTIAFRHVLPNIAGVVVIYTSISVPELILAESTISFLGLGVQEPNTSWGMLINEGASSIRYGTWWQITFPMIFFGLTQLSMFFIGDGLRDAIDPKERR